jgi:hypothetical protein
MQAQFRGGPDHTASLSVSMPDMSPSRTGAASAKTMARPPKLQSEGGSTPVARVRRGMRRRAESGPETGRCRQSCRGAFLRRRDPDCDGDMSGIDDGLSGLRNTGFSTNAPKRRQAGCVNPVFCCTSAFGHARSRGTARHTVAGAASDTPSLRAGSSCFRRSCGR